MAAAQTRDAKKAIVRDVSLAVGRVSVGCGLQFVLLLLLLLYLLLYFNEEVLSFLVRLLLLLLCHRNKFR